MLYQIISDSSCDLPMDYTKENNLEIIPFYVSFDGENYYKEGIEVDHEEFYNRMITDHAYPKSSLPSIDDYLQVFKKYAAENIPVICICITTKFSGSYQSAITAKEILSETYPDARITVIDSNINTVLQGIYVREAVRMLQDGISYEAAIEHLERIKSTGRIIFTIGSMDYLKKGGRIGKLLTLAGDTLGIKPLIILKEGEIYPAGITRSRKKAKLKLLELAKEHFIKLKEDSNNYEIVVGTGIDMEEAEEFKRDLEKALGREITLPVARIGVTIGTHTGPHPIGLGLIRKYDI
ncbi:DegV family protein [Clostridium sp. KNHs205]|jgi:DegV family protein with EDD domain|uniref:DegV family protein n=1 Tax=Clostridium sp. KNHs205 TaxID=1449050 RepID=UPI00051BFB16|nr:DegV family protein [Clostridium sp. KNHs205]